MTLLKHTGPDWEVHKQPETQRLFIMAEDHKALVSDCFRVAATGSVEMPEEEVIANANAIALAPSMAEFVEVVATMDPEKSNPRMIIHIAQELYRELLKGTAHDPDFDCRL